MRRRLDNDTSRNHPGSGACWGGAIGSAAGFLCGPCGVFFGPIGSAIFGSRKKKKAKKKLRAKIRELLAAARAKATEGVDRAVELAWEQGLCSTVPPIQIPAPDGDPGHCTGDYFDGVPKFEALAACTEIVAPESDFPGTTPKYWVKKDPSCRSRAAGYNHECEDLNCPPPCDPDWEDCGNPCDPSWETCGSGYASEKTCEWIEVSRESLTNGSLDYLMQCEQPHVGNRRTKDAWQGIMWNACLKGRAGDPTLHGEAWFVERQVSYLGSAIVNTGDPDGVYAQQIGELLQGAAAAAWQQAYNEAVAQYCPQGANTPKPSAEELARREEVKAEVNLLVNEIAGALAFALNKR